jgi:tetratricopeptide (TPR) repeat protein
MALPRHILASYYQPTLLLTISSASAQSTDTTADGLFQSARKAAFDNNDYPRAKQYLFRALAKAPNYVDIRIFLGRIYTWTKNYDSARLSFSQALAQKPDYEDGLVAYSDLEYFDNKYERSLEIVRGGLQSNPCIRTAYVSRSPDPGCIETQRRGRAGCAKTVVAESGSPGRQSAVQQYSCRAQGTCYSAGNHCATANANSTSSDQLLISARKAAFDDKNYAQAKQYLYQALTTKPGLCRCKNISRPDIYLDRPAGQRALLFLQCIEYASRLRRCCTGIRGYGILE